MPYLDHDHSHKRLAGVTGVALVHIVLAVGLTAGLAIDDFVKKDDHRIITDFILDPPPPPPPTPTPTEARVDPRIPPTAPDNTFDLNQPPPIPTDTPSPAPDFVPYTGGTTIPLPPAPLPPTPPQPPLFSPRGPIPANGPQGWVTTEDYPRIAITREYEGTVRYQVEVGANGRVQTCSVIVSSGYDVLDQQACARIERRARFRPGIDRNGAEVAGSYTGSVSWQLPN